MRRVLNQHFVVDEPMQWKAGDEPRLDISASGHVIRFVKVTAAGEIVPVVGHIVWTDRAPPPVHLTLNGVILYASFNVEPRPLLTQHVDRLS